MANEGKVEMDHSVLHKSIMLGTENARQVVQCILKGSSEVRSVLLNECNVLYECKVCRNLFRSLANLLAHKRIYCKEHVCETPIPATTSRVLRSAEDPSVHLTPVDGNPNAVFQAVTPEQGPDLRGDVARNPPEPAAPQRGACSRATYLSGRDDCDLSTLRCLACDTKYTSVKTLYLHMVSLHSTARRYYACPFCEATFVQMWGVVRHLGSVHKKTQEETDALKDDIRSSGVLVRKVPPVEKRQHRCSKRKSAFGRPSPCACREKVCTRRASDGRRRTEPEAAAPEAPPRSGTRPRRAAEKKMSKDFVDSQSLKWRSANKIETTPVGPPHRRVSPTVERKILSIVDHNRLECLRCERTFSTFSNLRRHAAIHLGYSRYRCTRCNYRSYNRSDCRSHAQRVHSDGDGVHVSGEDEERRPAAGLDALSTLVTRSGTYPKRTFAPERAPRTRRPSDRRSFPV